MISIVTTLYKSAPYLNEFHRQIVLVCEELVNNDFEVVYVVDGCPDGSLSAAIELVDNDNRVKVIDLSRNFGQHKAIMTGLAHTRGDYIFLLDSDLEEDPSWLKEFMNLMKLRHCDVIYGVQRRRKGNMLEVASGNLFYYCFRTLSNVNYPPNIVTARLMSRRYVEALLQHREREIFIGGLWFITGFAQIGVFVDKRSKGKSSYTFFRRLSLVISATLSFSTFPLIFIIISGIAIVTICAMYILWQLANWFRLDSPVTGWATVIVSIWLLGGLTITFLGVIGAYIGMIFVEVKQRPFTIVRAIYDRREH